MKFLLVSLAIIAVASAQYNSQQQQRQTSEPIPIIRHDQDFNPDGTYSWSVETGNGIRMDETGTLGQSDGENGPAINKQGQYSWTDLDGTPYSISYTADEGGFNPKGDHIPTAPPSPAPILRALEYIRSHPQPEHQ